MQMLINNYLLAVDNVSVLNNCIYHRGISVSYEAEAPRLAGLSVLHDNGIRNLTIFTKVLDELCCTELYTRKKNS